MNIRHFSRGSRGVVKARHWALAVLLFCVVGATAQAPSGTPAADSPTAAVVTRAADVIRQWQPHQRLYVKGKVGASAEALDGLERWLDAHATNWVVFLLENAEGETYTDAEGQTYHGVEAVNHALGKGLMNQTAFGQQVDGRTQERNAAFFVLFLKERRLTYYGSDAQDRRGLGEAAWNNNLDKSAVSAMRNGARVVDAAKDTITSINGKLDSRINAEIAARKKREADELAAQNRAREQARAALVNARSEYNVLEAKSGELARRFSGLEGDLVRPDLAGLFAELKLAQTAFDEGNPAAALRSAETVRARAKEWARKLDQYPADRQKFESLERKLAQEQRRSHARAAATQLQAAREALDAARREYERGNSSYVKMLEQASQSAAVASRAVTGAQRLAEQRRMVWLMGFVTLALGAGVLGLVLNRRRLPAKVEAKHLYALWETALSEKASALFGLLDRRATIIGTSAIEAAQRFEGETLRLCEQIIQEVDELFIMSACAGRVLQEAKGQVDPDAAWVRFANLFRGRPYRRTIALLKDYPIAFKPEEGLELVVRGARTERDRLIGGLASYRPFTMTFNQLIEAFNERAERALNALDLVETSLLKAPEELQATQKSIDQTRAAEAELTQAAADGFFQLAPVYDRLLPAAQQALSKALKRGIHDPVGARQKEGARARQQAEDAAALVAAAHHARVTTIPAAGQAAAALRKTGLEPGWIEPGLARLSTAADQAATRALASSAAAEIEALNQGLADLEESSRRALELNEARRGPAQKQIAHSTELIDKARKEIGSGLGLNPGEALREAGKDPTEYVVRARAQADAAVVALERGDLDAAANALEAVRALTSEADAIVGASRDAFGKHADRLRNLETELAELAAVVPEHARILAQIQGGYAPSVLALGAGDVAHPNANGTITDNIQEAEAHLAATRKLLAESVAAFRQARVLEAAALHGRAQGNLDTARHRLTEITEKQRRLETTAAANGTQLAALEQHSRDCARLADELTTMAPTIRAFAEAQQCLDAARAAVQAVPGDPFAAADKLADAQARLAAVADLARCDRDVFEQAGRSLAAAGSQLAEAERIASRSATDNVPDSNAVRQACAEIRALGGELGSLRTKHQEPHGDWPALDQAAHQLSSRAATAAATLKGELERAAAAVLSLSTAAAAVRSAGSWRGGFGVMILGAPGSDILGQAQAHLERGEYDLARRLGDNARGVAERAIAHARAEVQRRRREEEELLERERRRRQAEEAARRQRSSSSFGTGRSSSWGSSGSGTRSSSFRSGSGTSTSSW